MNFIEENFKRWVCPSDRELTLRAKLKSGWSSRTNVEAPAGINEAEQALISQVLERANKIQEMEDERIRKLNERLEKIKRQACGSGRRNCVLCNDQPGLFKKFYTCKDCTNAVCNKCSVDTLELETANTVWLCKICSEYREVLKKTNMWTQLPQQQQQQSG